MRRPLNPRQVEVPDDTVAQILRQKQPQVRLRIGFNRWISAHQLLTTHIRHTHPGWEQKAVQREVARRFLHGAL